MFNRNRKKKYSKFSIKKKILKNLIKDILNVKTQSEIIK